MGDPNVPDMPDMAALAAYINDHLAGSSAALQLLEHLTDSASTPEDREVYASLHRGVAEDRQTLLEVLARVGGRESAVRNIGVWLGEMVIRLKLAVDDPAHRTLAPLEELELLSLGILGKRALWKVLASLRSAAPGVFDLDAFDFAALAIRAERQHDIVETRRLQVARNILGPAAVPQAKH